ncbi:MAG: hypothetical protein ABJN84_00130 [Flavobacteriaceae bacterium]
MTEEQLHRTLNSGRLSKTEINQLVTQLLNFPELTPCLLHEVFIEDKAGTFNASWAFDHLMRKKLEYLLPSFEIFAQGLKELQSESCIRPMAHVCELVTAEYFERKNAQFQRDISSEQLELILTSCFDWLIGKHKAAAKVFAMTSLYHLGSKYEWVHPELKLVLHNTMVEGSIGYKNRAKKTLNKLAQLEH